MPPKGAVTWPSSEVPVPKAITGVPCLRADGDDPLHLLRRLDEGDGIGRGAGVPGLVLAVLLAHRRGGGQPVAQPDLISAMVWVVLVLVLGVSMAPKLAETGEFAMAYPAPFVGRVQKVEDQWTDYNGHFNMAYYNVLLTGRATRPSRPWALGRTT